jgi:hypothetical protein
MYMRKIIPVETIPGMEADIWRAVEGANSIMIYLVHYIL